MIICKFVRFCRSIFILWSWQVLLALLLEDPKFVQGYYITKPGCKESCENSDVKIPYPFGIGTNCYFNHSYEIVCKDPNSTNSSTGSYHHFLRKFDVQVLDITFCFDFYDNCNRDTCGYDDFTLSVASDWQNICTTENNGRKSLQHHVDLRGSPFLYSKENVFVVQGCPGHIGISNGSNEIGGCSTVCQDDGGANNRNPVTFDSCEGLSCLIQDVGRIRDYYEIELTQLTDKSAHNNTTCLKVALLDYYSLENISQTSRVSWIWDPPLTRSRYRGNPYLPEGCQAVHGTANKKAVILGLSISFGSTTFLICCYGLYRVIQRWRIIRRKAIYFKRNGGLLLQQETTASDNKVDRTKIFTADDLQKATDNFNSNRILGRGGQGTVYKGMLLDGRVVAVKKSLKVDESQIEHFINEVVILSQISHRNIVKLLGCCLETEVPLLVYEFISNGTLSQHIHNNPSEDQFHITWKMRLQIAAESAGALSYLHSASATPIYHRDVKTSNILLDEKYRAKVSDFGTSRTLRIDQTHLTTLVQGTLGYLDPEYFQTNQFTEKSDVYSFGVVLIELLTGKKPLSSAESGGWKSLTVEFLLHMEASRLFDILDSRILDEAKEEELLIMASLAQRCLNLNGKLRPTMKEVVNVLEAIRSSTLQLIVDDNYLKVNNEIIEMEKKHDGCVASSTICSENELGDSSSTEDKPFMHFTF